MFILFSGRRRNDSFEEAEASSSGDNVVVVSRQKVKRKQRRQTSSHQEPHRQDTHGQERALRVQSRVGLGRQHSDGKANSALGLEEDSRVHWRAGADSFRFHLHKSLGRIDAEGRLGRRSDGVGRRGRSFRRQALATSHL